MCLGVRVGVSGVTKTTRHISHFVSSNNGSLEVDDLHHSYHFPDMMEKEL